LAAANRTCANAGVAAALARIRETLLACIDEDGTAYQYLWLAGDEYCLYSAEVMQAIAALTDPADLDLRGRVDGADLAILAEYWHYTSEPDRCSCRRADINRDGRVDERDLMVLARNWLKP
jgi:hypothetical protein